MRSPSILILLTAFAWRTAFGQLPSPKRYPRPPQSSLLLHVMRAQRPARGQQALHPLRPRVIRFWLSTLALLSRTS